MRIAQDTEVVAACSRDLCRAQTFAAKHGVSAAFDSVDSLLGDSNVDAVFISSPNFLHAELTIRAAAAGKHVLVEKPMAVGVAEAEEMVRACRTAGVKLGVGFQLRHHPGHLKARQALEAGVLGVVSMAQAQWCLGQRGIVDAPTRTGLSEWWGIPDMIGGASTIMGTGVHALDLLCYLLDRRVSEVAAITDGQRQESPLEQRAAVALRFDDGTIGTVCCGRRMPDTENDATIYGSDGRISLRGTLWEALTGRFEITSESIDASESYDHDLLTLYKLQTEAFNRAILGDGEFHASGDDGLHSVKVTSAIIESASTGRSVRVS